MYCLKCGTQLPQDSLFCTNCGAKVDGSAPDAGPIAPPLMNQPGGYEQQPPAKKKTLLWVLIGAAAALIVAAVLVFVVFAPGGKGGPFSGDTVQTRFANDAAGVFTGAFSGFSDAKTDRLVDKPFDMSMKLSTDFSGFKGIMDLSAAYDEKTLGLSITSSSDYSNSDMAEFFADAEALESTAKILLLEDILYLDQDGTVSGLKFDTDTDLSKPMTLKNRIDALMENSQENGIDFLKLTEIFLNSIDESRFEKSADNATMTLDADALAQALDVFADRIKEDKELSNALNDIIKKSSGLAYDISDVISLAAPMLTQSDFMLTWTVQYRGGRPARNHIMFEQDGGKVLETVITYEDQGQTREIDIEVTSAGETATVDLLLNKTAKGMEFEGAVYFPGSDVVALSGWQEVSGQDISGAVKITTAGTDIGSIGYEGTVSIGKLKQAVEDDSRFEIDTDSATITDAQDSFSPGFSQDLTGMPSLNMAG